MTKRAAEYAPIAIKGDERVFLAGKTGSGKTHLAMTLLAPAPRLIVIDLKGTLAQWNLVPSSRETRAAVRDGRPVRVQVRTVEEGEGYMWAALEAGNVIVYIDEVYAFVPQGTKTPEALNAIWTRGREFGVGGWAAAQRPAWVPLQLISEADWLFLFRLTMAEDRKRLAGFMGEEVEEPIKETHGFFATRADWDAPQQYSGLNSSLSFNAEA